MDGVAIIAVGMLPALWYGARTYSIDQTRGFVYDWLRDREIILNGIIQKPMGSDKFPKAKCELFAAKLVIQSGLYERPM